MSAASRPGIRRLIAAAWLLLLAAAAPTAGKTGEVWGPDVAPPPGASLRVGRLTLHACGGAPAWCGTLNRPLDPSGRVPGRIPIAFAFFRHRNHTAPAAGTIVAQEGGPGFSTLDGAYGYLVLFDPLRGDHDVLMMDARGTGASGAIDCVALQKAAIQTATGFGACGHALGGARDLYGTPLAADDMAALLDALGIGKIDFYGDSYGTWFGQVFAARHPERLRSLMLDGAYPVLGESPWYTNAGIAVRRDFDLACRRSPACAALPGSSLDRIRALVALTAKHPIVGQAPDTKGKRRHTRADPGSIGNLLYAGVFGPVVYRDLDAAVRAYTDAGDTAPILRLMAESDANEDPPKSAGAHSRGLFAAVSCLDYPQIYDMTALFEARQQQRMAALVAQQASDPDLYPPLTLAQFLTVPLDISVLDLCLRWPVRDPPYAPGFPVPQGATFTEAPVLVINGELDMLTTPEDGAQTAGLFPNVRRLVVANSFHVDAVGDVDDCAQAIVRHFVATLDPGDTGCTERIKPVRMVPRFVRQAAEAAPARTLPGNAADQTDLAVAAAAVQTAGDVVSRWWINTTGQGVGLRGGSWRYTQPGLIAQFTLRDVRWTEDLAVSGTVSWDQGSGDVSAQLTYTAASGRAAQIAAAWNDRAPMASARLSGVVGGAPLTAEMPAP